MPQTQLIGKKAAEFAQQVGHAAALADKEEEIRIEVEWYLAFLEKETGIRLQGKPNSRSPKGGSILFYTRSNTKPPPAPATGLAPG